jgi:hypothetical protein
MRGLARCNEGTFSGSLTESCQHVDVHADAVAIVVVGNTEYCAYRYEKGHN